MGKSMYTKAKALVEKLREKHGQSINFEILRIAIMQDIGGSVNRTVKPYIKFMIDTQLINPQKDEIRI